MMNGVTAASAPARESTNHRFRLGVVVASVLAAIVGSVLLATHHSGEKVTTRGVTATLRVPGHPAWVAAGRDALWLALSGDPRKPVGDGPVDHVVQAGNAVWALEVRPGRLLRLDPSTLAQSSPPIRLSSGRTLGLAAGGGYLWVTAADAGEVLRIDPATGAITRAHVGGFPVGIVVANGEVWFADRSG